MKHKLYLPHLNSLRCVAALMVVVHHIEHIKYFFGLPNHWNSPVIRLIGNLGVVLFFVLSGFLITLLLLKESATDCTVRIVNFYKRRIVRIWPLYYLIVLLAFIVLPYFFPNLLYGRQWQIKGDKWSLLMFYIFLVPNFSLPFGIVPYASQLWSIGVEEQFYLIWPWLVKWAANRYRVLVTACLIIAAVYMIVPLTFTTGLWPLRVRKAMGLAPVNCMAIGAVTAVVVRHQALQMLRRILFHKATQMVTLVALLTMIGTGTDIPAINNSVYSILFAIVIINLACNPGNLLNLENKPMNYLGKISYGMYMYHPLMIVICIKALEALHANTILFIYPISIALTILVSALSYRYFESFFLSFKQRFSTIVTGDDVKRNE